MHILNQLKIELKAAIEAGGPSEETFYKVWNDDQRKSYIDEHPNSKFAQEKESGNNPAETNPARDKQNTPEQPSTKTSEVFNPLKKNFDPKTKEYIKKLGSSIKFKRELWDSIRSWMPSNALTKALPLELIDSLETTGSQWFNDQAAFANGYIDVDEYINKSGKNVSGEDKKKLEAAQFVILKEKLGKNFKENTKKLKSTVSSESASKFDLLPVSLQGKIASFYGSDDKESPSKDRLEQAINVASEMDNLRKTYPGAGFAYDREWMKLKPEGFSGEVQILLSSQQENPLKTSPNLGCTSVKEFFDKLSELKKDPRMKKLCPPFSDINGVEVIDRYDRLINDFNIPKQNLTVKCGKMGEIIFSYIDSDGREKRFTVDSKDPNKFLKYPSYSGIKDLDKFLGTPPKPASKGIEL